ncbi:uncharacterized protein [Mobula birostris]|uniref:uncharacterized protein n=1 Tax=Mobula birostris TaxID=1983395 RepID=UPI003B284A55
MLARGPASGNLVAAHIIVITYSRPLAVLGRGLTKSTIIQEKGSLKAFPARFGIPWLCARSLQAFLARFLGLVGLGAGSRDWACTRVRFPVALYSCSLRGCRREKAPMGLVGDGRPLLAALLVVGVGKDRTAAECLQVMTVCGIPINKEYGTLALTVRSFSFAVETAHTVTAAWIQCSRLQKDNRSIVQPPISGTGEVLDDGQAANMPLFKKGTMETQGNYRLPDDYCWNCLCSLSIYCHHRDYCLLFLVFLLLPVSTETPAKRAIHRSKRGGSQLSNASSLLSLTRNADSISNCSSLWCCRLSQRFSKLPTEPCLPTQYTSWIVSSIPDSPSLQCYNCSATVLITANRKRDFCAFSDAVSIRSM